MKDFELWLQRRTNTVHEGIFDYFDRDNPRGWFGPKANQAAKDPRTKVYLDTFAKGIGLYGKYVDGDATYQSLMNLLLARLYGINSVEKAHLQHIWNLLQQPVKKGGPTLAQQHGINRPADILDKVPTYSDKHGFKWRQGAHQFDAETEKQRAARPASPAAAAAPAAATPGSPAPSRPAKNLTPDQRTYLIQIKNQHNALENQLATVTTLTPAQKKNIIMQMDMYADYYKKMTGKTL